MFDPAEGINVLLEWSKYWLLSLNVANCKVVHIGSAPYVGNFCLNETQLELLENIRDNTGINVDSRLKFHAHSNTVPKKAYQVLGLISKSLSIKILMLLLDYIRITLVRPIIEYNYVKWGPIYILDNQKLERIQHKATRIIPPINHLSYHDRLRYLNLQY